MVVALVVEASVYMDCGSGGVGELSEWGGQDNARDGEREE